MKYIVFYRKCKIFFKLSNFKMPLSIGVFVVCVGTFSVKDNVFHLYQRFQWTDITSLKLNLFYFFIYCWQHHERKTTCLDIFLIYSKDNNYASHGWRFVSSVQWRSCTSITNMRKTFCSVNLHIFFFINDFSGVFFFSSNSRQAWLFH
jgi:hypothetical protein